MQVSVSFASTTLTRITLHTPMPQVCLSKVRAATDTIPYLTTILSPALRAVPGQMLTAKEQAEQHNLVNILLAYKLTYEIAPQEYGEDLDGNAMMKPAVDMLLSYPEVNQSLSTPRIQLAVCALGFWERFFVRCVWRRRLDHFTCGSQHALRENSLLHCASDSDSTRFRRSLTRVRFTRQAREPVRRRQVTVPLRQMLNQEMSQEAHRRAVGRPGDSSGVHTAGGGGGKRGRDEAGAGAGAEPGKVLPLSLSATLFQPGRGTLPAHHNFETCSLNPAPR